MRRFRSRPVLIVAASYLLLSALPLFPVLAGRDIAEPALLAAATFLSWISAWALFKRPAYFHVLLLPAFLALPVEIYLQFYFGQSISVHHIGILAETSPGEALEFIGNKVWLVVGASIFTVTWFALAWRAAWRTRGLDWTGHSRMVAASLLCIGLALWLFSDNSVSPSLKVTEKASGILPS